MIIIQGNSHGASHPHPVPVGETILAVLKAGVTLNSSATLAKVSGLSIKVEANATYLVKASVPFGTGGSGGAKFSFSAPESELAVLRNLIMDGAGKAIDLDQLTLPDTAVETAIADSGGNNYVLEGMLKTIAAGSFYINFAQKVSDEATAQIRPGAYLQLTKIAQD